mmetsp:Transcript_15080/g.43995  ORF Transcript_15080/g.43995 Transcript_15080/m.43995 type:complete len:197 (-) Transcript_15080:189-779(-)
MGTVASGPRFYRGTFGDFGRDNGLAEHTGKELLQHVFRTCFEALADDGGVLVVASVGPQPDVLEGLPAAPRNFILREAVPQLELLARCHAFVTHGGANSMHEALAFGVPLAVVPMFADQPLNADSVARAGAGFSFRKPLDTLTVLALRDAVRQLLDASDSNTYRAAAGAMMKRMGETGGVVRAAETILESSERVRN